MTSADDMTFAKCVNYCSGQGFSMAGVEWSRECYCGNMLMNGAALSKTSSNAGMVCSGDASSMCGASAALTLFVLPSSVAQLNADLNAALATATSAASGSASAAPTAGLILPAGWVGPASGSSVCIAEATSGRALTGASTSASDMTYTKCLNYCSAQGFTLAGIE